MAWGCRLLKILWTATKRHPIHCWLAAQLESAQVSTWGSFLVLPEASQEIHARALEFGQPQNT